MTRRGFRNERKLANRNTQMVARQFKEKERAARASARNMERIAQKTARAEVAAAKKAARQIQQVRDRQLRQWVRQQKRQEKATQSRRKARSKAVRRAFGRAAGAALRGVGAVGLATAGVVGLAARQSIGLQDRATRLAIKGGGGGVKRVDPRLLRQEAETTAKEVRGAKAGDIISAQERFVSKTGKLNFARDFGKVFAEISVATGTAAEDIGSAAADMFEKFDIKTVEGMTKALSLLAVQGKRGAFEMEDAAAQFPKIGAAAQRFGLKGVGGLATLGGLSQIARRSTKGGEEAGVAVENMFTQLILKSGKIKQKFGVDVFEDKGKTKTRPVQELLVDIIGGAKGNIQSLQEIFAKRAAPAVSPLISLFNQTRGKAMAEGVTEPQATADAMARLREEIDKATNVTNAEKEVRQDLAIAQKQTSAQMTAAWENVVAVVGQRVAPKLAQLAGSIAEFIESSDFTTLETGFTAVAEAAMWAADVLGLFEKGVDPERKALLESKANDKKLVKARKKLEELPYAAKPAGELTPAQVAKRATLQENVRKLEKTRGELLERPVSGYRDTPEFSQNAAFTQDEFIAAFMARGGLESEANEIAQRLIKDPGAAQEISIERTAKNTLGLGNFGDIGGPNELLKQSYIARFGQSLTEQRTLGGAVDTSIDTSKVNEGLAGVASSAKAAMAALGRIGEFSPPTNLGL
jgi:hypothetical protein